MGPLPEAILGTDLGTILGTIVGTNLGIIPGAIFGAICCIPLGTIPIRMPEFILRIVLVRVLFRAMPEPNRLLPLGAKNMPPRGLIDTGPPRVLTALAVQAERD